MSRFQDDNNPIFNLPENVAAYAIRSTVNRGKISFNTEYAYKYNDPAGGITYNNFAPGSALMTNLSYSQRGLGIILKRTELIIWITVLKEVGQEKSHFKLHSSHK